MKSTYLKAFSDELEKISAASGAFGKAMKSLHKWEDPIEVAGLGVLGGIGADRIQAHVRAGKGASDHEIEKKQLLGETGHAIADTAGLGILAAPLIAKRLHSGSWVGH
jgi:UDP-N-acetylmuramyl pentapeptide synthase